MENKWKDTVDPSVNNRRQGDVHFFFVGTSRPKGLRKAETPVLALGEATNHVHSIIEGTVWIDDMGDLYVEKEAGGTARARHHIGDAVETIADHSDIEFPATGFYRVVIPREYTPEGYRRITD